VKIPSSRIKTPKRVVRLSREYEVQRGRGGRTWCWLFSDSISLPHRRVFAISASVSRTLLEHNRLVLKLLTQRCSPILA
jgi:hypothetical protein